VLDVPTFQFDFFEFAETDPALIERALARAQRMVDATVWGDQTDDAVGLLTAHYLAMANRGSNEKVKPGQTTTYWDEFVELRTSVVAGFSFTGC
jgi:hypothetical protein